MISSHSNGTPSIFGTIYYLRSPSPPPVFNQKNHNSSINKIENNTQLWKSKSVPFMQKKEVPQNIRGVSGPPVNVIREAENRIIVKQQKSHSAPNPAAVDSLIEQLNNETNLRIPTSKSEPMRHETNKEIEETQNARNERKSASVQLKRDCVRKAHYHITKSLQHFKIPQVKTSSGLRIVRICCRTPAQLQNIVPLLSQLMKQKLVVEIGMPLKYEYKMKSLVLFIKPTNIITSMQIELFLKKSVFNYHVSVKDIKPPEFGLRDSVVNEIKNCVLQKESSSEANASGNSKKISIETQPTCCPNCKKYETRIYFDSKSFKQYAKIILVCSVVSFLFITTKITTLS